jgi:large subunit ribosomal protein L17
LEHGKIQTTDTRAKETRSLAEKMITLGKRGDLHARRQALAFITRRRSSNRSYLQKLATKYADRNGGYTRMYESGSKKRRRSRIGYTRISVT